MIYGKIHIHTLALSLGIVWGVGLLILGLSATVFGYGVTFIDLIGSLYVGYAPTALGALIGGVWGFIDAYVGGLLIGWLYNTFSNTRRGDNV